MRILFSFLCLFLVSSLSVRAQDVGTQACGDAQEAAQEAVGAGGPFKNKGQTIKAAANVVGPLADSEDITEDCAGCILNKFAKGVGIEDQDSCGSAGEPDPGFCNNVANLEESCGTPDFPRCNVSLACPNGGVCFPIVGASPPNIGFCNLGNWACANYSNCPNGEEDCNEGEFCVESCCPNSPNGRKCLTADLQCFPSP